MAKPSPASISESAANDNTAETCPDRELVTLVERCAAAWRLSREVDDDAVDAVYDTMDALRLKAGVYRMLACSDAKLGQPIVAFHRARSVSRAAA
jgi:hypothetical protein